MPLHTGDVMQRRDRTEYMKLYAREYRKKNPEANKARDKRANDNRQRRKVEERNRLVIANRQEQATDDYCHVVNLRLGFE